MTNQNITMDSANSLFDAISVITRAELNKLNYNKTLVCTIIDASKAETGNYIVTDGISTFIAYADKIDYKKDDRVYVIILNGDMEDTKLIIGKQVTATEDYIVYTKPLDSFIDITNNLINTEITGKLIANKNEPVGTNLELWRLGWLPEDKPCQYKNYTNLAIRAKFKTILDKEVNLGNYGLRLEIREKIGTEGNTATHEYLFDVKDMYGNPYQFSTYFSQEKLFDISSLGEIVGLKLSFYQKNNFMLSDGNYLSTNTEVYNLLVKDIYIALGYDAKNFLEDTILLDTNDSLVYSTDTTEEKKVSMYWIHKNENKFYSIEHKEELPKEAKIHWYRSNIDVDVYDKLAGYFWEEQEIDSENLFNFSFKPDTKKNEEKIKVIIECPSNNYISLVLDANKRIQELINQFFQDISDDIKKMCKEENTQKINDLYKDIRDKITTEDEFNALGEIYEIIIDERALVKYYKSEEIKFTNAITQDRENEDLIKGFKIETYNDRFRGVYNLYLQNNNIMNSAESDRIRELKASYTSLITGEDELTSAEEIIWYFPARDSMITYPIEGKEYKIKNEDEFLTEDKSGRPGYVAIKRLGTETSESLEPGVYLIDFKQAFRIKDFYEQTASNNTIYCRIKKRDRIYESSITLSFGPAGDLNAKANFKLDLYTTDTTNRKRIPALTVGGSALVIPKLYDYNNKKVDLSGEKIEYSWTSNFANHFSPSTGTPAIKMEKINGNNCRLTSDGNQNLFRHSFHILKATLKIKNKGIIFGSTEGKEIELVAYLPIAVRAQAEWDNFEGPTQVIYNEQGINPTYYKGDFKIFNTKDEQVPTEWFGCGEEWFDLNKETNPKKEDEKIEKFSFFYPTVSSSGDFIPKSMFYTGLGVYAVFGYRKDVFGEKNSLKEYIYSSAWTQPILMIQNLANQASILQDWDGNLTIDEENGIILSSMMGAGVKNSNHTFSGVLMGDVGKAQNATNEGIGLYGYYQGNQSFGFKVDGTAFIGFGDSKITFNGKKGEITGNIIEGNTIIGGTITGSKINNGNGTFEVDANGNLTASSVNITGGAVDIANNFIVESNGNVTIKQGNVNITTGNINLGNGNFEVNNDGIVTIKNGAINLGNNNFVVNNDGIVTIKRGSIKLGYNSATKDYNFSVDDDGNVNIKNGSVNITEGSIKLGNNFIVTDKGIVTIKSGEINLGSGNFIVTDGGIVTIKSGSINIADKFKVNNDGSMEATSATITGTISGSTITGTEINNGNGTFKVTSNGSLTATSATITGTISSSTISGGKINIKDNFIVNEDGTVQIKQGNISLGLINGTNNYNFSVNNNGQVVCKNIIIDGGEISLNTGFKVTSAGVMTCNGANINGAQIDGNCTVNGTLACQGLTYGGNSYTPHDFSFSFTKLTKDSGSVISSIQLTADDDTSYTYNATPTVSFDLKDGNGNDVTGSIKIGSHSHLYTRHKYSLTPQYIGFGSSTVSASGKILSTGNITIKG